MIERNEEKVCINVELSNSKFYNNVITNKNKIYDNGGSKIYHKDS